MKPVFFITKSEQLQIRKTKKKKKKITYNPQKEMPHPEEAKEIANREKENDIFLYDRKK